jgi:hypothetical protein
MEEKRREGYREKKRAREAGERRVNTVSDAKALASAPRAGRGKKETEKVEQLGEKRFVSNTLSKRGARAEKEKAAIAMILDSSDSARRVGSMDWPCCGGFFSFPFSLFPFPSRCSQERAPLLKHWSPCQRLAGTKDARLQPVSVSTETRLNCSRHDSKVQCILPLHRWDQMLAGAWQNLPCAPVGPRRPGPIIRPQP